ncbi:hypothetical protein EW146_g9993, partial [Bondarzewia mesenterica]
VRGIINHTSTESAAGEECRQELVDALFKEILERVGDREKEFAMRWWEENRAILELRPGVNGEKDRKGKGKDNGAEEAAVARL